MFLRKLYLHNFRCYSDAAFEFCPGINTICGPNAQGKTTILEAIHYLITGSSFRTTQLSDLTAIGQQGFYLEADFVKHGVEQKLRISCSGKDRKIVHNSTVCSSTSSLLGLLQGVVTTPDDVALVKGAPVVRRQFLDLQIAQVDPLYVHHLTRYHRAMRQRNALLKAKSHTALDSWEHEMANSAAYVTIQRNRASVDLQSSGSELHKALTGNPEDLSLGYKSSAPLSSDHAGLRNHYSEQFQRLRHREMLLGCTLTGPHKDDMTIAIGGKEVRFFASEGQQRSCVAALHLAEWHRLNTIADETPLMLIDDLGISLDNTRRDRLLAHVCGLGQVFLTTTQEFQIPTEREHCVVAIT